MGIAEAKALHARAMELLPADPAGAAVLLGEAAAALPEELRRGPDGLALREGRAQALLLAADHVGALAAYDDLAAEVRSPLARGRAFATAASIALWAGDIAGARARVASGRAALAAELDDDVTAEQALLAATEALAAVAAGDRPAALAAIEQAGSLPGPVGAFLAAVRAAATGTLADRNEAARRVADVADDELEPFLGALLVLACAELAADRPQAALTHIARARAVSAALPGPMDPQYATVHAVALARVALAAGNPQQARRAVAELDNNVPLVLLPSEPARTLADAARA